ncbi:hypothetical protein AO937_31020 [Pseudomonas aeruginosa]|nr:hypothetical protein AO937_31020 [Pseudomonas aeruginosa]
MAHPFRFATLAGALLLAGCQAVNTTSGGAVGVDRKQYCSAARNSSACCAINPTRLVFQWWKRNFRIARRVPPGYPN